MLVGTMLVGTILVGGWPQCAISFAMMQHDHVFTYMYTYRYVYIYIYTHTYIYIYIHAQDLLSRCVCLVYDLRTCVCLLLY